jgi:hypothetical protein
MKTPDKKYVLHPSEVIKHFGTGLSSISRKQIRQFAVERFGDPGKNYYIKIRPANSYPVFECWMYERKVKNDTRKSRLLKALGAPSGLSSIAKAIANPVRRNLDYKGVMRNFVKVKNIDETNNNFDDDLPLNA